MVGIADASTTTPRASEVEAGRAPDVRSGASMRPDLSFVVGAVGLLLAFVVHARAWRFVCDDAFISFRYAYNLAEHGALAFNVDPTLGPVEGYTNFAWVVLLAAGAVVGLEPHELATVLTWSSALAGLVAVTLLVHALRCRAAGLGALDLVPAALLVASPEYVVWSHGGLETSMAAALVVGAMAAWALRRRVTAAALAAVAGLTRPDALLPIAMFGAVWLVLQLADALRSSTSVRAVVQRVPWQRVALAAVVFVVPLGAHLVWRRAYYGAWLPNTWAVKAHGALLRDSYGIDYVRAWVDAVHLVGLTPLLVLVRPRHAVLLVPALAVVAYAYAVGGDFMAYGRFMVVATALLAGVVGWLLADAVAWVVRIAPRYEVGAKAVALVVGIAMAGVAGVDARRRWAADRAKPNGWLDGKWEGVTAMDRFARVGWAVGRWMRDNLPADTLITVGAAGAVPYASRLRAIDAFGLVDAELPRMKNVRPRTGRGARPGHQLFAPASHMKSFDADLYCHMGYRGEGRPSPRVAHPSFRAGYTWACIEPEPVDDPLHPGETFDVGVYCCRRPIDRVVGPFGATGGR